MDNGTKIWEIFPKQRAKRILSNKSVETLFTQCIKQLLRSGYSWVDFNPGCQIRDMLGFPRAILKDLQILCDFLKTGEGTVLLYK